MHPHPGEERGPVGKGTPACHIQELAALGPLPRRGEGAGTDLKGSSNLLSYPVTDSEPSPLPRRGEGAGTDLKGRGLQPISHIQVLAACHATHLGEEKGLVLT